MGVSEKTVGFPPKSSILIGFSIINHPFWGTIIYGNTHHGVWKPWRCPNPLLLVDGQNPSKPPRMMIYPTIHKGFNYPRWLAGFCPSTVCYWFISNFSPPKKPPGQNLGFAACAIYKGHGPQCNCFFPGWILNGCFFLLTLRFFLACKNKVLS